MYDVLDRLAEGGFPEAFRGEYRVYQGEVGK